MYAWTANAVDVNQVSDPHCRSMAAWGLPFEELIKWGSYLKSGKFLPGIPVFYNLIKNNASRLLWVSFCDLVIWQF